MNDLIRLLVQILRTRRLLNFDNMNKIGQIGHIKERNDPLLKLGQPHPGLIPNGDIILLTNPILIKKPLNRSLKINPALPVHNKFHSQIGKHIKKSLSLLILHLDLE
jgi:hypothetical protein